VRRPQRRIVQRVKEAAQRGAVGGGVALALSRRAGLRAVEDATLFLW
jgi:hypothetical protein